MLVLKVYGMYPRYRPRAMVTIVIKIVSQLDKTFAAFVLPRSQLYEAPEKHVHEIPEETARR
jgi:hypothetical protein